MSKATAAQEPSMEEILASIRKIISDDGPAAAAEKEAEPEEAPVAEAVPEEADSTEQDAQSMIDDMFADGAADMDADASEDDIDAIMAAEAPAADPVEEPSVAEDDVMDLTEDMVAEPIGLVEGIGDEIDFGEIEAVADVVKTGDEDDGDIVDMAMDDFAAEADAVAVEPPPAPNVDADALMSEATKTAVSSAFSSLAGMMLSNNARTLEDLVADMLRPMLKEWIDNNLPGLVEKIVRAEIERVSRGGR